MTGLLYRQDFDAVRQRLSAWWKGEDIGRPILLLTAPCEDALENIPAMPRPEGYLTDYSTSNFDYRLNQIARCGLHRHFLGEAMPASMPCLGPNCLALYLGCRGVEQPGTVWFEPFLQNLNNIQFKVDPDNFYWKFNLRLIAESVRLGQGKFLTPFPDLIEGLDALAAMRGSQELLFELLTEPEKVKQCLDQITGLYFHYYDRIYDLVKDDQGGSHFWMWAPGRFAKLQCDISAMLSPEMFREFMEPVLRTMTARLDFALYHWDGPGATVHHDSLLSLPDLHVIQWTPGAGAQSTSDPRWWPLYHKTIEAGKAIYIGISSLEEARTLKREFGPKLKRFVLVSRAKNLHEAEEFIREIER
ncbi:hypothetical protein HQ520_03925 [bacterium]|nr:hypothetical protein [bacterium]